jgi:hypothetical protein
MITISLSMFIPCTTEVETKIMNIITQNHGQVVHSCISNHAIVTNTMNGSVACCNFDSSLADSFVKVVSRIR